MRRRLLQSFGLAIILAVGMVFAQFTIVPVEGQESTKTAWGHPDLEGIWLDVYDLSLIHISEPTRPY